MRPKQLFTGHLLLSMVCLLIACAEPYEVPNSMPIALFDSLEGQGDIVDIYYTLFDDNGDDLSIDLNFCVNAACNQPTEIPGGDGLDNLPTRKHLSMLHLFRWAALCDLDNEETEFSLQIRPYDGTDYGDWSEIQPFSLSVLGVSGDCE
jgi:hypothetical protein